MILVVFPLALVLLLAPRLSGVPDEPLYSSWLCAAALLAALAAVSPAGRRLSGRDASPLARRSETAFGVLLGLALLSLLWRLAAEHGLAYVGPMLRGWTLLATDFALFALARRVARGGRAPAYALVLTAVLASGIVSMIGVMEYGAHRRAGDLGWRVFATSTPDFLAGYLVILLPLTLALFLGVPLQDRKRPLIGFALGVLLLVVLAYQTATLLWTQSRFALVSITVGILVLLASLAWTWRKGLSLEFSSWVRLGCVLALVGLIGLAFAKPLMSRLRHTSSADNSTAFRLYTWRGSLKMAAANPVLGTGVGTYVHLYPRYAVTGFTRLAHDSYIQMADECGLPGLLALLLTLGFTGVAVVRGLSTAPRMEGEPGEFLAAVAPPDDRVLLCGLLGGLAASAVQNLIDSDWYVFFLGVTFWALAGLAVGLASPAPPPPEPAEVAPAPRKSGKRQHGQMAAPPVPQVVSVSVARWRIGVGIVAALVLVRMATQGLAAMNDQQGASAIASADGASAAEQDWSAARVWDPLNARYPNELGNQVYFPRPDRLTEAERALRDAVGLEPSSLNYASLAKILAREHRYNEAVAALQDGLKSDPNSLDLRLLIAQLLPPPQSVEYMRQVTQLEDSPVGQVRAIGNITEYKFALADAAVADAATDPAEARRYYQRAARLLEAYADEGGTTNIQRQVLIGDHPDPGLDKQMADLYAHVMTRLVTLSPPADRPGLQATAQTYSQKFASVFARASQPGTV